MSMRLKILKYQAAFTLLEVVIAMTLSGFFVGSWLYMFYEGFRDYYSVRDFNTLYQQGQLALERFSRDIEAIRPSNIVVSSSNTFSVNNSNGHTVTYTRNNSNTTFMRQQDSLTSQPLAFYLDPTMGSPFTYYKNDAITTTTNPAEVFFISLNLRFIYTAYDGSIITLPMSTLVYCRGP